MRPEEFKPSNKAGVIPYFVKDEEIYMMFMVPSNPKFGGSSPQIAKGRVEDGENIQEAALREAEEELGLRLNNIESVIHVTTQILTGFDETYNFTLFAAKVSDPDNFGATDHEVGGRFWLTFDEFLQKGRSTQKSLVQLAYNKIK
ncbi:MAG TPA: NUDIX domain-containing protein [Methanosarcina sp.]|nr:NUDIX domain-containing protein [Methanosarcina sp.]